VVLALALFLGAATVISSGLNASIQSAQRLRQENHAANLAISIMSEMQMHARPIAAIGPEPLPRPFQDWNYKIEVSQEQGNIADIDSLRPVEVIIRHSQENTVYRITQLFRAAEISASATNQTGQPVLQTSQVP